MASEVDICNSALIGLGQSTILSLDDESERASKLKVRYPLIRDAELRRRRWKFSIQRASLAADAAAPDSGFALQYTLPARCLRLLMLADRHVGLDLSDYRAASSSEYSLEGRSILTNFTAPLPIRFIARIEDTGLFDACFVESLAARVQYEMCEALTQSDSKKQAALLNYRLSIQEAVRANALETPPQSIADDTWIAARAL